jgi:hypothetical protein
MTLAITGLLYLGMFALAAGMSRHGPPLLGAQARFAWLRRPARYGWALVALSALLAIFARDGGQALVLWFGAIPLVSAIILLGLTYRPAIARGCVVLAALLILAAPFA